MNQLSLNTAILSFAFSGMLAPHKREYESPRRTPSTIVASMVAPTKRK